MKSIFNKFWVLTILVTGFTISSCSDLTELNVDPNSPTAVPASNLVTQAQFSLYNLMHSRGVNAEWSMYASRKKSFFIKILGEKVIPLFRKIKECVLSQTSFLFKKTCLIMLQIAIKLTKITKVDHAVVHD